MKRWQKITLVLLGLFLLSQLPFIYRRYQFGRLRAAIAVLNSQRVVDQSGKRYQDYKGVIHVHSSLGGHSAGSFEEIIRGTTANELHFVVMTEHPSGLLDTAAMTLKGFHQGVLFVNGNEVSTSNGDRLLLMPGDESANTAGTISTQEVIDKTKARGGLAFIAYPHEFRSIDAGVYDGIEVYNLYTNTKQINLLVTFFDGLWSYSSYADLMFASFYERPNEALRKWDDLIKTKARKLVALAGNDAHSNVGISLQDATGKKLLGVQLDPYERSFRLVRMHVLIENGRQLTSEALLAGLGGGHCYISFDLFCDATGFSFTADNGQEQKIMGDEIFLRDAVRLTVAVPVKSRIVLLKDGEALMEGDEVLRKEFLVDQRGSYRIEVYLPQLQNRLSDNPWIISNPIYVR